MATIAAIIGRIMIGALFILAGLNKVMDTGATAEYIQSMTSLPGALALPTGIFEIAAGLLLASGIGTRLAAGALIAFIALATILFHSQVTDPIQAQMALKNLAIIGGLLMVFAYGQVRGSLGTWRERDKRHDAEVEAARAEGKAEAASATTSETAHPKPVARPGD
jgi:putative oxidoreductase